MAEYKYTAKHATSAGMQPETQWTFYKGQQTKPVFTPNGNGSAFINTQTYEIIRAYYELEELASEGIWYYFKADPNTENPTMHQLSPSAGSYRIRTTVDIPPQFWQGEAATTGYGSPFAIVFKPTRYDTQSSQYTRYIQNVKLVVEAQLKASAQTFTIKSAKIGEQQTINISNDSTAVSHKVVWNFGSGAVTSGVISLAPSVRTVSWTVPKNKIDTVCNMVQTDMQYVNGIATVTTFLNGVQIGNAVSHTARLYMTSAQGAPEVEIATDPVNIRPSKPSGDYVQNFDNLRVTPTVTGKYSATISNITISAFGKTYTTTSGSGVTIPITSSGTIAVAVQATDSRGFNTTESTTITVVPYKTPAFSNIVFFKTSTDSSVVEDDEGEYLYLTAGVSRNATQGSQDVFQYSISETGGQQAFISGTMSITWSGKNGTVSGHIGDSTHKFDKEKTYEITLTITDGYGLNATYDGSIQAAIYTIHRQSGGQGVAFGKISELQGVEVNENWPVYVYGQELKRLILDCANPVGSRIVTYDLGFDPNTEWPWTLWALYNTNTTTTPPLKTWIRAR